MIHSALRPAVFVRQQRRALRSSDKSVGLSLMLKKLEYVCAVGSIALIGADRIDLFGGYGFFRLSPFLLFASLVVSIQLLIIGLRGHCGAAIRPPFRRQIPYLAVLALFLLFAFASTIFGVNPQRGLVSLFDLVLVAVLGYCLSLRILADPALAGMSLGLMESCVWRMKLPHPSNRCLRPRQPSFGRLGCQASVWIPTAPASFW